MYRRVGSLAVAAAAILAGAAAAQGPPLPPYRAINPVVASRTGLAFNPVHSQTTTWQVAITLDYASIVELDVESFGEYILDAEVLRLAGTITRRMGTRGFVSVTATLGGAYAGFLDGPLDAYHDLIGLETNRNNRPTNEFAYRIDLPDGRSVKRAASDGFLGDVTLGGGILLTPHWQVALQVVLPTSTGPEGYGVGTVAGAITTAARSRAIGDRLTVEGSTGMGYSPTSGDLAEWQRTVFALATAGARLRFWGRQSAYINFIYHSPVYRNTTYPGLDEEEFSIDTGFLFQPGGGPEILAALTEDLSPSGPAVDVVFRLGVRW